MRPATLSTMGFLIKKLHSTNSIYAFVRTSKRTAIICQHWLAFILATECIYCAVRKEHLNTRAVHKETEIFLIYCSIYNLIKLVTFKVLPPHSWYTAPNVFSIPGTCFAGRREGPVSNFLLSPLPSEIGSILVRISTSGTRRSSQGPNLESRAAGGQQSFHAS